MNVTKITLQPYSFPLTWVEQYDKFFSDISLRCNTLQIVGYYQKEFAKNEQSQVYVTNTYKLVYERNGEDGIQALFIQKFNESVRVKKSKKIISSVTQYFKD